MMTPEENDLLCRVEGDAPMGQIMRRHWIAACLSEEVAEPDGAPVKVRLLGEDLVVFRDSKGRVGVLDEYCSHRRASLLFARNEDCGLRCLYHGWKFDVDGNIVEMASEPDNSLIFDRVKHKSYPTREAGGFVWTYMGPPEDMREFEPPAFAPTPDARVSATKVRVRCNWAQILEGQIDSAHSSHLHSSDMVPAQVDGAKATEANWLRPSTDKAPRFQIERTSYGFRYAAIRRPIKNEETHDYIRTTVYIAPYTALIPPNNVHNVATLLTPEDDTNTIFYFIAWNGPDKPGIDADTWRQVQRAAVGRRRRPQFRRHPQSRQPLSAGPRGDEGRQLHRHQRHPQPGHRDVGVDGADRRPLEGKGRRQRRRGGGVPPADGRGRARHARWRSRDRHDRAAYPARDHQLLRRGGAQDDELAQPWGRQRSAAAAFHPADRTGKIRP